MLRDYLQRAERGEALWLGELREAFSGCDTSSRVLLRLTQCDGTEHDLVLLIPPWENAGERAFVLEYIAAFVFNLLSCFGGRELCFYLPKEDAALDALLGELDALFQIDREDRIGYGKVISIANRLNRAFGGEPFRFRRDSACRYTACKETEPERLRDLGERLRSLPEKANSTFSCGIDVGGTDIKAAISQDGNLLFTKEYDWDPASYGTAGEIVEPILLIARLLRLGAVCPEDLRFLSAVKEKKNLSKIRCAVSELEAEHKADLRRFDSLGLSFPDVVIRNRILGGETPKTGGLRHNPSVDYETEFAKLDQMRIMLQELCKPEGHVRIANDGCMAAFTAAVEMAAKGENVLDGVFAHSLGTDLGTGWLNEKGEFPPIPLEMYDFLLDLGSYPQRNFPPEDVRSVRNENSGLPDARKYLGQSAAFRLADEIDPGLLEGFLSRSGEMLQIRKYPDDLRKACLEHLMCLAEQNDKRAKEVFRRIGYALGQISRESVFFLQPRTDKRYLYGRFVKHAACFALLRDGFHEVMPALDLVAADDDLACSPLMRQLSLSRETTVAQFGQAVGAIYYGLT